MNQDQLTGILRIIVPTMCAWLAAHGVPGLSGVAGPDAAMVGQITTAVIAVAAVVWSFMKHTDAGKIEAVAAIDPQVKVSVPVRVMVQDSKVAALVADTTVPNVVASTIAEDRARDPALKK